MKTEVKLIIQFVPKDGVPFDVETSSKNYPEILLEIERVRRANPNSKFQIIERITTTEEYLISSIEDLV